MAKVDQTHAHVDYQFIADNIKIDSGDRYSPEQLFSLAKDAIKEELYEKARDLLNKAASREFVSPDLHYYLALSWLCGRKPSTWGRRAEEIMHTVEGHLRRAWELVGKRARGQHAHLFALWGLIKKDYYRGRPGSGPGPDVEELLGFIAHVDPRHVSEIAPFGASHEDVHWREAVDRARKSVRERRPTVHKYFIPDPLPPDHTKAHVMMITGCGVLLVAMALVARYRGVVPIILTSPLFLLSVATIGGGLLTKSQRDFRYQQALARARPKPTDEDMDRWLDLDRLLIVNYALTSFSRPPSDLLAFPHMIIGPADNAQHASGRDGVARFSIYKVVVLMLTRHRLSIYTCEWDFINCGPGRAETFDCRYSDVTCLCTKQMSGDGPVLILRSSEGRAERVPRGRIFEMIIAGTTTVVVVFDAWVGDGGRLQPTGAEAAETMIRNQLNLLD